MKQLQQQQEQIRDIEVQIKTMGSKLKILQEEELLEDKNKEEMEKNN